MKDNYVVQVKANMYIPIVKQWVWLDEMHYDSLGTIILSKTKTKLLKKGWFIALSF